MDLILYRTLHSELILCPFYVLKRANKKREESFEMSLRVQIKEKGGKINIYVSMLRLVNDFFCVLKTNLNNCAALHLFFFNSK